MISSSALHVGRHGSTHSLQQVSSASHSAPRACHQQHTLSTDSPRPIRRHHDTITEGGESTACSEDDKSGAGVDGAVKNINASQSPSSTDQQQLHKKGSNASKKDQMHRR